MKKLTTPLLNRALAAVFALSFCFVGGFHEYTACLFGLLLAALLIWYLAANPRLELKKNSALLAVFSAVVLYGVNALWAVDPGMALIGFFKFLPVLLFVVLLQLGGGKALLIGILPEIMAVMAVLSAVGSVIPGLESFFLVADRLAGFLQYPNTFALLLLVSQLIVVSRKRLTVRNCVVFAVLLLGILYSGSRTVFLLTVGANLVLAFLVTKGKKRLALLCAVVGAAIAVVAAALLTGSDVLGRFLRFSFLESTFAGRLLYFWDAIPLILKHPFGIGYWGYYYAQQSVQTGVYSTAFVHNDFLQMMLDVGWIPCVCLVVAMVKSAISKNTPLVHKVILGVLFLHSCFDFDLQYLSAFFVLLLFLDHGGEKTLVFRKTGGLKGTLAGLGLASVYIGVALLLPQLGLHQQARTMYPWNTVNNTVLLTKATNLQEGNSLADEILEQNDQVNLAYSMRARYAYSTGDFRLLMDTKKEIFERFPFQYAEYEEYCRMLVMGISLYEQSGDEASAQICREELISTRKAVEALADRQSLLGKVIKDQPTTKLPEDLNTYIDELLP